MNKKLIMIVSLIAAMSFAGCGKNDDAEITEADVSESVSDIISEEETGEDVLPEADDEELEEILGAVSEDSGLTDDDTLTDDSSVSEDDENNGMGMVETGSKTYAANTLSPIIDKVLSESEWPVLCMVTDETIKKEFFLLDSSNDNYKEMIVMQCPISAGMSEIIIINAEDVSAAEEDLDARRQKAIDQDAWYPNDVELAQSSIVGTNGSYAYFILGTNAAAAEESINSYIDAL